ncbi:MAG: Ig-like domain repeat protein [Candidatus Sulfotelmatobacter sp.]
MAPASLPMQRMLLVLKRSPQQESALRKLLDDQQDKSSSSYHQWLTPADFGKQFGPTDADLVTITGWLQSHGFQVGQTKGRTVLEFSGNAGQVQQAFHTTIHKYIVHGEEHWANASDPSIPTALTAAVAGVASLNNFPKKAMNRFVGRFQRDKATGRVTSLSSLFTFQPTYACSADYYCFALGPYDFATIYNVLPLWNAKIDGAGQTIAIVGESNINPQDVANFRALFDLPSNNAATGNPLNIIINGPDPGIQGDESEADIDVQWSGAVAPYATLDFVVSQSTETTAGVDLSAVYIIDNNLAPVMSESYGACELGIGTTGNQFYNTLWQQAAAQGITVLISAGDNGSAGCDNFNASPPAPAENGLQVSGFASTPYNVAVGGTDFNDSADPTTYWSTTNNSLTQASALGYIPETTWNDSCSNGIFATLGYSTNPQTNCANPALLDYVITVGGSGGASNCTNPSGSAPENCAGGYAKPSWQSGTGVPNDGKRDLPDVSLFAGNGFSGNFYIVCQSDQFDGACTSSSPGQDFLGFGGTSVSSPAFAGIMALVNQQTGSRQGNANYVFYKLAAKQTDSVCNSTSNPAGSCIFYDVTMGTNAMPCFIDTPNCNTSSNNAYGVLTGYSAGTGYDQATGLGSVNANNLVTQWNSVTFLPSTTTLNSLTPTTVTHGQPVSFSVTVAPQSGAGTPTGEISLLSGLSANNSAIGAFGLTGGSFSGSTDLLPGGTYSVKAYYPGDGNYAASDSNAISVTVNKENSSPQVFLVTFDSNGNVLNGDATTAPYGSPYILRVNLDNAAGQLCSPVETAGATSCPSGTVTLTDNGAALDAGTYTLNSYAYFEDSTVQLPGGTNSIKAQYSGDSSFNASASTTAISITPAETWIETVNAGTVYAGQAATLQTQVQTQNSGVAPTGTVTFSVNGSSLAGTLSLQGIAGSGTLRAALTAVLSNVTFNTAGQITIVASYSGDSNYAPATSSTNVTVMGHATNTLNVSMLNPQPGASVTLTDIIDTAAPSPTPSGHVFFFETTDDGNITAVPGTVTYVQTTDSNGNAELQASVSFVPPTFTTQVQAQYAQDLLFQPGNSNLVTIVIAGNDFSVYAPVGALTAAPGQSVGGTINIYGESDYTGTINFASTSCSGLPAETACSFSPASVTGTGSTNLTIQTTAAQGEGLRAVHSGVLGIGKVCACLIFGGIFFVSITSRGRKRRATPILALLGLLVALPSCGGGSSTSAGGGISNPGTPLGNYTVTVTATSGSGASAITHTTTFQLGIVN